MNTKWTPIRGSNEEDAEDTTSGLTALASHCFVEWWRVSPLEFEARVLPATSKTSTGVSASTEDTPECKLERYYAERGYDILRGTCVYGAASVGRDLGLESVWLDGKVDLEDDGGVLAVRRPAHPTNPSHPPTSNPSGRTADGWKEFVTFSPRDIAAVRLSLSRMVARGVPAESRETDLDDGGVRFEARIKWPEDKKGQEKLEDKYGSKNKLTLGWITLVAEDEDDATRRAL